MAARADPSGVHVSSKWGYVYTAGWQVDHDPPEVKHHDLVTFQRQLNESRENLGEWLGALPDPLRHARERRAATTTSC